MTTLDVRHVGGEVKTLVVVGFTDTALFLLWPMCGVYELKPFADDPILLMRRNRGSWRAADPEKAKEVLRAHLRERNAKLRELRYGGGYGKAANGNQRAGNEPESMHRKLHTEGTKGDAAMVQGTMAQDRR